MDFISKFLLCVLPTQCGKTFVSTQSIDKDIKDDEFYGRSINIVFTMNSICNNQQFASRLDYNEQLYGKGSVCIFSSKHNAKYTHVKSLNELQGLCLDRATCPHVVVLCGNPTRFGDAVKFVQVLDQNRLHITRVMLHYDELHKYITNKKLRNQIECLHGLDIVKRIIGFSATPDKIWSLSDFWANLNIIKIDNYSYENYAGCKDMKYTFIEDYFDLPYCKPSSYDKLDEQTIGFIKHVIKKYPNIISDHKKVFIPGHIRCSSHYKIRNYIFSVSNNAVVIVINGMEKTIQFNKDNTLVTIDLKLNKEELCELIAKQIIKEGLESRPIIITGCICVSMGQTLMHELLGPFTDCIISHLDFSNDDIYQLFGRILGRIKTWSNYRKTRVYCPLITYNRCDKMEDFAKNIFENFNGLMATNEDYKEPMKDIDDDTIVNNFTKVKKESKKVLDNDRDFRVFDTQEEAIKFAKEVLKKGFNTRKTNKEGKYIAPLDLLDENGNNPTVEYLVNRLWGANDKTKARMTITNENKWCVYWKPSLINVNQDDTA